MKCHQRIIREQQAAKGAEGQLFGAWWDTIDRSIRKAVLREIDWRTAASVILEHEWLGTMPNGVVACFGIFYGGHIGGAIVFASPSMGPIGKSALGDALADKVVLLARGACVHWAHEHSASRLIAHGLREMGKRGYLAAVAYSDPMAGEIGTVYQATNWLYCGLTAKRPDYLDDYGERAVGHFKVNGKARVDRPRKHRYLALLGPKKARKATRNALLWPVLPYPKRST